MSARNRPKPGVTTPDLPDRSHTVKVIYTFEDNTLVEGELDLDPVSERAVRNATTLAERRDILDALIIDHALSDEQQANGTLDRRISFGINGVRGH
jgi:hypothetical protein